MKRPGIVRRSKPAPPPRVEERRRRGWFEIQLHPADIRKRVRYLFFSRRHVAVAAVVVLAYLSLLGFAFAVAPEVVGSILSRRDHELLLAERERHGERLGSLVANLESLKSRGADLQLRLDKVFLAYGLPVEESIGQGGFPVAVAEVPETLWATKIERANELQAELEEQSQVIGIFLDELRDFEGAHAEMARSTPSRSPLRGEDFVLTSPFGQRRSPFTKQVDFHAGIDLAAPLGTPVHAPADGIITFADRYELRRSVSWWRYGNLVVLRSGDFITLFGHLDEIHVRRGQRVSQGDVLGSVGNTGWSTSPHLHYEVRRRGEDGTATPLDPRIYILDHRWRGEERLLVSARTAPKLTDFEPLPGLLSR